MVNRSPNQTFVRGSNLSKNNLFVDDEVSVLQSYERMLHGEFEVDTALSGKAALASIQEKGPYAVVVSDIRMPGIVQLLARLRQVATKYCANGSHRAS